MRQYKISFRLLKKQPDNRIIQDIRHALDISYLRAEQLCQEAYRNAYLKINVTAEQLGNLQALRIMKEGYPERIRYLADVEELSTDIEEVLELRPGYRTRPQECK